MDGDATRIAGLVVEGIFYVLLLVFVLHALFLGYHWFSYGESRKISMTALASYLLGGAVLFLTISASIALL